MCGYLAIRIYFGPFIDTDFKHAWSTDPLKRMPEIPAVTSYNKYAMIRKHFKSQASKIFLIDKTLIITPCRMLKVVWSTLETLKSSGISEVS